MRLAGCNTKTNGVGRGGGGAGYIVHTLVLVDPSKSSFYETSFFPVCVCVCVCVCDRVTLACLPVAK